MKKSLLALFMLFTGMLAAAQTQISPTISNGQVQIVVPDSSGGSHVITFPVTAITDLSVGVGSDTYTAPPPPPPPPPPPTNGAPEIPASAIAVDLINPKTAWKNEKDAGTPGTATFSNNYPVSGIFTDDARAFSIAYQGGGGVRFSNNFAKDTAATHFVYDTVVESPNWAKAANLELDLNQVKANGKTSILGVQCSTYSKTWEVTLIAPSTSWHWVKTNVPCNTPTWTPNVPHHIRIFGDIDTSGVSTYTGVELDGVYTAFNNFSGTTARELGWSIGSVLPNFQIDGLGTTGSVTIYADKLTIYRW
jgi:hypothetical protein